jgi:CRISPR-associated protein Cmr1
MKHYTRLFGSADTGQSGVLLSIEKSTVSIQQKGESWTEVALGYLGYGPLLYEKVKHSQVTQRPYIKPDSTFTIRCCFRPWLEAEDTRRIVRALKAWTLFGGLGARSRRGFGSLQVDKLETHWDGPPNDLMTLEARCQECLDLVGPAGSLPEHTAFSSQSVIKLVPIPNKPSD